MENPYDDDCFYYHSWRNNVVIAFGTLSSYTSSMDTSPQQTATNNERSCGQLCRTGSPNIPKSERPSRGCELRSPQSKTRTFCPLGVSLAKADSQLAKFCEESSGHLVAPIGPTWKRGKTLATLDLAIAWNIQRTNPIEHVKSA